MDNALDELLRTFGLVERALQPFYTRFGISGAQWGVLRTLYQAEQEGQAGLRLTDLSQRLLLRPPSVTGLIDRLERSDLVRRSVWATDLRAHPIRLTRAGRRLVQQILAEHEGQMHVVLEGLNANDQTELTRLLAAWRLYLQGLLSGDGPAGSDRATREGMALPMRTT